MDQPTIPAPDHYALYYPFIHIRDENWLKATLLAFQQVRRIVPYGFTVRDEEVTHAYSELEGPVGPLLATANIWSEPVRNAQLDLQEKSDRHRDFLVQRYSYDSTPAEYRSGDGSFQIHRMKILAPGFVDSLVRDGLAWNTRDTDEHDSFNWLTMHPQLGAAIMSTLALAVAQNEGLDVVTPSGRAHNALLSTTAEHVFEKLLDLRTAPNPDLTKVSSEELCQLVVTTGFDLTRLSPQDIQELIVTCGKELREFHDAVNSFARRIPGGLSKEEREKRMKKESEAILEAWSGCVAQFPKSKEALLDAALDKSPDKIAEAIGKVIETGTQVVLLGTVKGLILSIVVSAGAKMLREKKSPFKFLSKIDRAVGRSIGSLYVPQWRELAGG